MKKNFLIYFTFIIMFFIFPTVARADNAVCIYEKRSDSNAVRAAVHVVNGKAVIDIYRSQTPFNKIWQGIFGGNSDEIEKRIGSIIMRNESGQVVDASSYFLSSSCPNMTFCEDGEKAWLIKSKDNCTIPLQAFDYVSQMSESSVSSLDVAIAFSFTGDKGKPNYTTILGSCPSDVGALKLLSISYGILKIVAPILLVVFGMIDMAKAVTSSDESKMKKAQSAFVRRIIAAVIVLLSFVIVEFIINLFANGSDVMDCVNKILK